MFFFLSLWCTLQMRRIMCGANKTRKKCIFQTIPYALLHPTHPATPTHTNPQDMSTTHLQSDFLVMKMTIPSPQHFFFSLELMTTTTQCILPALKGFVHSAFSSPHALPSSYPPCTDLIALHTSTPHSLIYTHTHIIFFMWCCC